MSSKTHERIVRIRAIDETTPVMLGITRTMGGMRREINALRTMLRLLADDEFMAALAAGELGAMLQLAIPIIGVAAGLISILVGMRLTATRAAIPIGQTLPGQIRQISATGPILAHKGEVIGRPLPAGGPGGGAGGGGFTVQVDNLYMRPDGEDADAVGRTFARVRAAALSTDVPMS